MPKNYEAPTFVLSDGVDSRKYKKWLTAKARAHVKRDAIRKLAVEYASYKDAIHAAVLTSEGKDAYTGEKLDWSLIGRYNNEDSKKERVKYKKKFALLPTVDHIDAEAAQATFTICGWRTNDAKNDMSIGELRSLCERVLEHAGYAVERPLSA